MPSIFWTFNWVDVFVVICLIRTGYIGFSRGLSPEIPRFLSVILVIVLSYHFCGKVGQFLSDYPMLKCEMVAGLSFISLVVVLSMICKLLCVLSRLIKVTGPHMFEVVGGLMVGLIRGFFVASLVLVVFSFIFPSYLDKSVCQGSFAGCRIIDIAPQTYDFFNQFKQGQE